MKPAVKKYVDMIEAYVRSNPAKDDLTDNDPAIRAIDELFFSLSGDEQAEACAALLERIKELQTEPIN